MFIVNVGKYAIQGSYGKVIGYVRISRKQSAISSSSFSCPGIPWLVTCWSCWWESIIRARSLLSPTSPSTPSKRKTSATTWSLDYIHKAEQDSGKVYSATFSDNDKWRKVQVLANISQIIDGKIKSYLVPTAQLRWNLMSCCAASILQFIVPSFS